MSRASTVGVLVLAAAIGLLLSLYGPAIPELRSTYGVGGGGSALALSAHFAGAMTGIGWWGLERRLAPRTWLLVAVAVLVAGAAGIAFAPAWPVVLAAAFGLGVGFGVVVVEIYVLFAVGFGERSAAMLNLLGACFGAGAVLGPLTTPVLAAGSLLVAVAGLGLAHLPAIAPAAYTLTGLALGPVFPSALAWLAQAAPGARGSTAMVFAAAQLGGVVLPAVIGRLVDASSPAVIPTTVLVVALACLGATLLLRRSASHAFL